MESASFVYRAPRAVETQSAYLVRDTVPNHLQRQKALLEKRDKR